jgi:hypothetical protein
MKRSRWGAEPRAKFLAKLAATANVNAAAKAAGYGRKDMYELRAEDKDFAAAWDEAEAIGCDAVDAEIRRRIVEHNGRASKIREDSDALRLAQLKAHRPETHSDRVERAGTDGRAQSSGLAIVALKDHLVVALNKSEAHGKRLAAAGVSYASIGDGSGNDAPVGDGIGALAPMR